MPNLVKPEFGRLIAPDRRDKDFPLLSAVDPTKPIPDERLHSFLFEMALVQRGPTCVGHGVAHAIACAPWRHAVDPNLPYRLYDRAQDLDEWEGKNYDGTSVRAGIKAAIEFGLIKGDYRWTQDEATAWRYLMTEAPLVIGVTWTTGMMSPDKRGYLNLTGGEEGGHCVCLRGGHRDRYSGEYYLGIQSWNEYDRFKLRREDFKTLLEELGGECGSFTEVDKGATNAEGN